MRIKASERHPGADQQIGAADHLLVGDESAAPTIDQRERHIELIAKTRGGSILQFDAMDNKDGVMFAVQRV